MLIGKELLKKVDELKKLGHDDQFIFSACGYSSEESFNTAFFYSKTAKTKSNKEQDKDFEPKQYLNSIAPEAKARIKKMFSNANSPTSQTNAKEKDLKKGLVKGKYLASVDRKLTGKYSDEEIAIACGYYETKDNGGKVACIDTYLEARVTSRKQNEFVHIGFDMYETELAIFKGCLIIPDDDHGGTVYIPKRIVDQSKDWDYSKSDLRDLNVDYFLIRDGVPENYKEDKEYLSSEEYLEDLEDAKQELEYEIELNDFHESMMAVDCCSWWFIDDTLNPDEPLEDEDIAEFYGLRYEDCHPGSRFCDG